MKLDTDNPIVELWLDMTWFGRVTLFPIMLSAILLLYSTFIIYFLFSLLGRLPMAPAVQRFGAKVSNRVTHLFWKDSHGQSEV